MNKTLSVYLDLARFVAALMVFFYHAKYERFDGAWLSGIGQYGHDAVMVFFVLSGFVIAYITTTRPGCLSMFARSRLARLYSVVIPALLLTVILDYTGMTINPDLYTHKHYEYGDPVFRFFSNLFFVNELWFNSWLAFSNSPFWSLCYEFWYYAIYATIFYFSGTKRLILLTLVLLITGPKILLLFPVWLTGVCVYKFGNRIMLSKFQAIAFVVLPIVIYALYKNAKVDIFLLQMTVDYFGQEFVHEQLKWSRRFLHDYILAILFAIHLIGMISLSKYFSINNLISKSIIHLAGMTFALYLFHFPILQFLMILEFNGIDLVITTFCIIYLLAFVTERRKKTWQRLLENTSKLLSQSFNLRKIATIPNKA